MKTKQPTSIRLTEDAKRLLEAIAAKLGISQGAVLELVIRDKAVKEKVK